MKLLAMAFSSYVLNVLLNVIKLAFLLQRFSTANYQKYSLVLFVIFGLSLSNSSANNSPDYLPALKYYNDKEKPSRRYGRNSKEMTAPAFLKSKKDPDTHRKVWRLGGSATEMGGKIPHPNGNHRITITHAQHFYSRTRPTNVDESYVLGSAGRGTEYAALWRLLDKQFVAWLPTGSHSSDPNQRQLLWDKIDNNVYWFVDGNQLMRGEIDFETYEVNTDVWQSFPCYESISFGQGDGDFSDDGEKIVLIGRNSTENEELYSIISYSVNSKKVVAHKSYPAVGEYTLNAASLDPAGDYIVFNWPEKGRSTWVMPFNLKEEPRLLYKHSKHSDFVVDKEGKSWIVFVSWQGVFAAQLSRLYIKRLWPTFVSIENPEEFDGSKKVSSIIEPASGHISRVSGLPGFVLLSRNIDGGFYFINIDQPGASYYIGNSHHGNGSRLSKGLGVDAHGGVVNSKGGKDYLREPRGSASASGKYIFFVSDYYVHGEDYTSNPPIQAYLNVIELE